MVIIITILLFLHGENMVYQVRQTNKKTGVTYIYEATSFWDKEKKQARNRQVCIGKLDPITNEFIPSKKRAKEDLILEDPNVTTSVKVIGPSLILDHITNKLGIRKLLKKCFPKDCDRILSMVYYLTSCGDALCNCVSWCKTHKHPSNASLDSQRITEILRLITTNAKQTFFSSWIDKVLEEEYVCYDITSISSYSKTNEYVKYGYNRDREKLPQINLAMLHGQKSGLPVYYQRTPGNISDVSTLKNLLRTFKFLDIKPINFVMDKGFYSKDNINKLMRLRSKFTISIPIINKWVKLCIDEVHQNIQDPECYRRIDDEDIYVDSRLYPLGENKRRCYLHLYYNDHVRANAVDKFNESLFGYREELESGQRVVEHKEMYDTFFIVKKTPKRGLQISYNKEAVSLHINRYAGFQAILTNSIKDPVKTLQVYRDKDKVEKCFDDLKNQLDMKRLRMHNSETVDGRLFIQFLSLIYVSALRKELRESKLIEKYSVRELLREMETLVEINYSGKYGRVLTEITKPQKKVFKALKIDLPK